MTTSRWITGLTLAALVVGGCVSAATAPVSRPLAETATTVPLATPRPAPTVASTPRQVTPAPTASVEPSEAPTPEPEPSANALPPGAITAAKAKGKVGKVAIVCGTVVRAKYATSSTGKPTFLDLDKPYPKAPLTIVIWKEERGDFTSPPEKAFIDQVVCIQGRVESYKGRVQITAAGGDVFPADEFTRWPKDAMSCVREGSRMSFDCSVWLDVVVEMRQIEADLEQDALDAYGDAMDDLYEDPGESWIDDFVPAYP